MENDQRRDPRVRQLERALQEREERIADLEARLEAVRDASSGTGPRSATATDGATNRASGTRDGTGSVAHHGTGAVGRDAGSTTRDGPGDGRGDRHRDDGHGRADGWTGQFDPPTAEPRVDAHDGVPDERRSNDSLDVQNGWHADRSEHASTERRPVVAHLRSTIEQLDPVTRKMLAHYHEYGPASPLDAHVVAGGDGDRTAAYRRNGVLREASLVVHVGRGRYATRLRQIVVDAHGGRLDEEELRRAVGAVEEALPVASPPEMAADWPEP